MAKVRISFTLDIDVETWATEYGTEPTVRAVAADVREHVASGVHAHMETLGVLSPERTEEGQ